MNLSGDSEKCPHCGKAPRRDETLEKENQERARLRQVRKPIVPKAPPRPERPAWATKQTDETGPP